MVPPGWVPPPGTADTFVLKPVRRSDLLQAMLDEVPGEPEDSRENDLEPRLAGIRPRVLVVDDNPMNLQVARAMLERLDLDVHAVGSGNEALSIMDRMDFQVILMDEQMPGMDGLEATRRIRGRAGDDASTPVVALTANADKASEQRCLAAGMDGFLTKPVRRKAVRALLSRWLPSLLDAPERSPGP
jgi:CheY-like chemotaxis protein